MASHDRARLHRLKNRRATDRTTKRTTKGSIGDGLAALRSLVLSGTLRRADIVILAHALAARTQRAIPSRVDRGRGRGHGVRVRSTVGWGSARIADSVVQGSGGGGTGGSVIPRSPVRRGPGARARGHTTGAVLLARGAGHFRGELGVLTGQRADGRVCGVGVGAAVRIVGGVVVWHVLLLVLGDGLAGSIALAVAVWVALGGFGL